MRGAWRHCRQLPAILRSAAPAIASSTLEPAVGSSALEPAALLAPLAGLTPGARHWASKRPKKHAPDRRQEKRQPAPTAPEKGRPGGDQPPGQPSAEQPRASASGSGAEQPFASASGSGPVDERLRVTDADRFKSLQHLAGLEEPIVTGSTHPSIPVIRTLFNKLLSFASSAFVKRAVETEHDDASFLAGTEDALLQVNECLNNGDWEALKGMVSTHLWRWLKSEHDDYRAFGLREVVHVEPASVRASDPVYHFLHRSKLAKYDEAAAEEPLPQEEEGPHAGSVGPGTAAATLDPAAAAAAVPGFGTGRFIDRQRWVSLEGFYQVAAVEVSSTRRKELFRQDDRLVLSHTERNLCEVWVLFRGPLPTLLPRRELALSWRVLKVQHWRNNDLTDLLL